MMHLPNNLDQAVTYMSSSTSLRQTPESMTVWIFSLGPSDRQDRAQQASARTSGSLLNRSLDSTLRQGDTQCTPETRTAIGTVEYQSWMNTQKEGRQVPAFKFTQKTRLLITYNNTMYSLVHLVLCIKPTQASGCMYVLTHNEGPCCSQDSTQDLLAVSPPAAFDMYTHLGEIWWWVFPSAEVGQGPDCIAGCCETV